MSLEKSSDLDCTLSACTSKKTRNKTLNSEGNKSLLQRCSSSQPKVYENKFIYFWGDNDHKQTEWYGLDVIIEEEEEEEEGDKEKKKRKRPRHHRHLKARHTLLERGILSPISMHKYSNETSERCVAMDSVIYRIGGEKDFRKNVRFLDVRHCDAGWSKCAPMNHPRRSSYAVVLDRKLYVFGGNLAGAHPEAFAEVYDPTLNQWEPLPPPPLSRHAAHAPDFAVAIESFNQILVGLCGSKVFHMYDPKTSLWEQLGHMRCRSLCGRASLVEQTMYCYVDCSVEAIDLEQNIHYKGCLLDCLSEDVKNCIDIHIPFRPTLFHLSGDMFCLFWVDDYQVCSNAMRSHCLIMRIVKCSTRSSRYNDLDISIQSCQSYDLDRFFDFYGALMLDASSTAEIMQD